VGNIIADKAGGAYSMELEIQAILPLLFLEKNFVFPRDENSAEFTVDVLAQEREYISGWDTKRSISVQVLMYSNDKNAVRSSVETPVAAARVTARGREEGLASSKNLEALLRKTVRKAASIARRVRKRS
jgi:hypothetical protein